MSNLGYQGSNLLYCCSGLPTSSNFSTTTVLEVSKYYRRRLKWRSVEVMRAKAKKLRTVRRLNGKTA